MSNNQNKQQQQPTKITEAQAGFNNQQGAEVELDPVVVARELADLRAKLDAAQQRADELEERERERALAEAGVKVNKDEIAFAGADGGYRFEVGPQNKECGLEKTVVIAVDESEAIRWYCRTRDYPVGSGKQVDPCHKKVGRIIAVCKDPKRDALIRYKHQLANIRRKINSGIQLTDHEAQMLQANEAEVFQY